MSSYRLVVEIIYVVYLTVCQFSELVQFNPAKKTFADVNLDAVFLQSANLLDCIRRLLYILDLEALGEPAGSTCEYLDVNGNLNFKKSLQCNLGNILQLSGLWVLSFVFELSALVKNFLTAIAIPTYWTSVQIPTLANTQKNLDAALCQFGGLIASVIPVSFSCSATEGANPGANGRFVPRPKPVQVGEIIPTVAPSRISVDERVTTASATALTAALLFCSNCSDPAYAYTTNLSWFDVTDPNFYCRIACIRPELIEFPLSIGLEELPLRCRADVQDLPLVRYQFDTATDLAGFLAGLIMPSNSFYAASTEAERLARPYRGVIYNPPSSIPFAHHLAVLIQTKLNLKALQMFTYTVYPRLNWTREALNPFAGSINNFVNFSCSPFTAMSAEVRIDLANKYCTRPGAASCQNGFNYFWHSFASNGGTSAGFIPALEEDLFSLATLAFVVEYVTLALHPSASAAQVRALRQCIFTNQSAADRAVFGIENIYNDPWVAFYNNTGVFYVPDVEDAHLDLHGALLDGMTRTLALFNDAFADNITNPGGYTECTALAHVSFRAPANGIPLPMPAFGYCVNDTVAVRTTQCVAALEDPLELCTWSSDVWKGQYPVDPYNLPAWCDCSHQNYGYLNDGDFYTVGVCALYCDPPPTPFTLGRQPEDCLVPSCHDVTYVSFFNRVDITSFLEYTPYNPLLPAVPTLFPGFIGPKGSIFINELLTAALNVHYAARYRPNLKVYFRTVDDPLMTIDCFPRQQDRELFGGMRWDVAVDLVNRTFFGGWGYGTCEQIYRYDDIAYASCSRFIKRFPRYQLGRFNDTLNGWLPSTPTAELARWAQNATDVLTPMLQLINTFRPKCGDDPFTPGHECLVVSEFNGDLVNGGPEVDARLVTDPDDFLPPAVSFVGPQYDRLVDYTVPTLVPCSSTISCGEQTLCTAARFFVVPLVLISEIIDQLNLVIATGTGTWTLGTGFWEILKKTLNTLWIRASAAFLSALSSLDCIACAISGNVVGSDLCSAPLFGFFKPIFGALYDIGIAVINTFVDLLRSVVLIVAYFFTGNWDALVLTLIDLVITIFVGLIVPLLKAVFSLVLSFICVCNPWNALAGPTTFYCENANYCPDKKRSLDDFGAQFTTAAESLRRQASGAFTAPLIQHLYEVFAGDWPANSARYSWPSASPCNTSMPALAPLAPQGLARDQALEAAFCLGLVVLFPNAATPLEPDAPSAYLSNTLKYDPCDRLAERIVRDNLGFADLTIETEARALQCISDRGSIHGLKQEALDGALDWVEPSSFSSPAAAFMTAIRATLEFGQAGEAVQERDRDAAYAPEMLQTPEYRSSLSVAFESEARLALANATAVNATVPSVEAYVDALDPNVQAASRKRTPLTGEAAKKNIRIKSVARLFTTIKEQVLPAIPATVIEVIDRQTASLPVLYTVTQDEELGTLNTASTQAILDSSDAREASLGTVADLNRALLNSMGRAAKGSWVTVRSLYTLTTSESAAAVSLRRAIVDAAQPRLMIGALSTALKGVWVMGSELVSGRAMANATGTPVDTGSFTSASAPTATQTAFKWTQTLASVETAASVPWEYPPGEDWRAAVEVDENGTRTGSLFWPKFWGPRGSFLGAVSRRWTAASTLASTLGSIAGQSPMQAERYRRVQAVQSYGGRIMAMARNRTAFREHFASASAGGFGIAEDECLTDIPDLCANCLYLDRLLGTLLSVVVNALDFFGSTSPRPEQRISYLLDDFDDLRLYLSDASWPVRVGDSVTNPIRFPSPYVNPVHYVGDPLVNKLRFSDMQDLVDRTTTWFSELWGSLDLVLQPENPYNGTGVSAANGNATWCPRPTNRAYDLDTFLLAQARSVAQMLGVRSAVPAPTANSTAGADVTAAGTAMELFTILSDWATFVYRSYARCDRIRAFDGSEIRYSLGEAAVLVVGLSLPILVMAALWPQFASVVFSMGGLMVGGALAVTVLAIATGWSPVCLPGLPIVLWTKMGTHFLYDLLSSLDTARSVLTRVCAGTRCSSPSARGLAPASSTRRTTTTTTATYARSGRTTTSRWPTARPISAGRRRSTLSSSRCTAGRPTCWRRCATRRPGSTRSTSSSRPTWPRTG